MTQALRKKKSIIDPLEAAAKQFDDWRKTREKRGPIPEELWALAVSLTAQYGFTKIIKKLRLGGLDFKKRLKPELIVKKSKAIQLIDCSHQVPEAINSFKKTPCLIEFTCKNASVVKLNGLSSIEIQNVVHLLIGHS